MSSPPGSLIRRAAGAAGETRLVPTAAIDGGEAGLTLIETVIALAIGMLVVVFLAEGTGLLRHFAVVGHKLSAQDEVLAVRDHLRRQVESTMRDQSKMQQNTFAGIGDTVVFTAPGDRLLEGGGPVRVTLTAVPERGSMTLAESRAPQPAAGEKPRTDRLITGARRISFSYFGPQGSGAPDWTAEWTDPEVSPTLLRIDLAFPNGDERRWPPLVIFMPSGGASKPPASPAAAPAAPTGPPP